jgi:hypothetical protein
MSPINNKEPGHEKNCYNNFFVPASGAHTIGAATNTGNKGEDAAGV